MNTQNTTSPLHHIAAVRLPVVLLFCLLIAQAASAAAEGSHAGIAEYTGAETCLACHQEEGEGFVTSIHNTWMGEATHVVGKEGNMTGKVVGVNEFCVGTKSNEALCGTCHAGYGICCNCTCDCAAKEMDCPIEKIDCLICHAPNYKKTLTGPAPSIDATAAARGVGLPTREMCLRCHATAGGGDNNKRGDIELAMGADEVSRDLDVHMSAGMTCQDCHVFIDHHVSGRGMDLRVDDTDFLVTCDDKSCHGSEPHYGGSMYNQHTDRIYCTACHVTSYGKVQTVEMSRDWEYRPPNDKNALHVTMYTPYMVRESNPAPIHVWWNRWSEILDITDPAVPDSDGFVMMAKPVGGIDNPASKIYAARLHLGRQPWDGTYLLPFKTMTVLMSDNMTHALFESTGKIYDPIQYVNAKRYMGLFHGISPKDEALTCKDCHEDHVIDFEALGYDVEKDASGNLISATKPGESLNLADFNAKAATGTGAREGSDESAASTPGFGIVPALGGLMAVAYLLRKRN
nr:cytochrome c putative [uncultured archaeon GZfos27A8]